MIEIVDGWYSYPGRGAALKGLSAAFSPGLTLLAGANASGKSTLLRLLSGLIRPDRGVVRRTGGGETTAEELRRMGRLVIQDADPQILGATVGEDVELGRAASNLGGRFSAEAEGLAERFGLRALWNAPVETLSFGQKKRLNLLNALLAGPELLLLDEPFEALDYPSARELRGFIAENRTAGVAQIISTHDLEPVFDLADRLVVIKDGLVVAQGKPDELVPDLSTWSVRTPGERWD